MIEIILSAHGGAKCLHVQNLTQKPLEKDKIRIKNVAVGVNFIDIYQRNGLYPMSLPAVLGQEGVGIITEIGTNVSTFSVGDRVAYLSGGGGFASETIVLSTMAAAIPDAISDDDAAAAFLKGLTVQMLVKQVFPLSSDHIALIYAAAGGVGSLLCQWANYTGARIIGVVGNEEKAARVKKYGVHDVINRSEIRDIKTAICDLTNGAGVNVVYDSIGAATFETSLDCLAPRGMMVTYGNASGAVPPFSPLELAVRGSLFLTRPNLFHYATPDKFKDMAADLFGKMEKEIIKPSIHKIFPLADAATALTLLESGQTDGAIILKP